MKNKFISLLTCAVMLAATGCADSDSNAPTITKSGSQQTSEADASGTSAAETSATTSDTAIAAAVEATDTTEATEKPETDDDTAATTEASAETEGDTSMTSASEKKDNEPAKTTATTRAVTTAPKTTTAKPATVAPSVSAEDEMSRLIKAHNTQNCAVIVYSMDGEELYSYDPNKLIYGASLIKLPYVYYCCTQLSNGIHSLNETMTYTSDYYIAGSGVIAYSGYGKKYTVSQLIDYTLRYSDNCAYSMLVHLFGIGGFNQMISSWGYSNISINNQAYFVDLTASFMKTAMLKMQEKSNAGGCWSVAWSALTGSSISYARQAIGGGSNVAVKYGNYTDVWNETCYVSGSTPYILVIFSGGRSFSYDYDFVMNAARCADRMVKEHYRAKTTTTTMTTTTAPPTTTTAAVTTTTPTSHTEALPPEEVIPDAGSEAE